MYGKTYFTEEEALMRIKETIVLKKVKTYDDILEDVFNTNRYLDFEFEAENALSKFGMFEALGIIERFGDRHGLERKSLKKAVEIANRLEWIVGHDVLYSETPIGYFIKEHGDEKLTNRLNKDLIELIDVRLDELNHLKTIPGGL